MRSWNRVEAVCQGIALRAGYTGEYVSVVLNAEIKEKKQRTTCLVYTFGRKCRVQERRNRSPTVRQSWQKSHDVVNRLFWWRHTMARLWQSKPGYACSGAGRRLLVYRRYCLSVAVAARSSAQRSVAKHERRGVTLPQRGANPDRLGDGKAAAAKLLGPTLSS